MLWSAHAPPPPDSVFSITFHIELGRAPVQVELGPLGLFRGRECLFFRFRVAFSLYIRAPEAAQHFGQRAERQSDTLITTFGTQGARASERACSACAHAPLSDQRETLVGLPIDAAEPVVCPHIKQVYGSVGLCFGGWSGSFADSTAHSCSISEKCMSNSPKALARDLIQARGLSFASLLFRLS